MEIATPAEIDNELFSAEFIDQIAVITFKKDLLLYVSDLNLKELLFDYLDGLSKNDHVRLILIIGSPEKKGMKIT